MRWLPRRRTTKGKKGRNRKIGKKRKRGREDIEREREDDEVKEEDDTEKEENKKDKEQQEREWGRSILSNGTLY